MTLQGTVVNGAIVIDGTQALPEGTRVWIELETEFVGLIRPGGTVRQRDHTPVVAVVGVPLRGGKYSSLTWGR